MCPGKMEGMIKNMEEILAGMKRREIWKWAI